MGSPGRVATLASAAGSRQRSAADPVGRVLVLCAVVLVLVHALGPGGRAARATTEGDAGGARVSVRDHGAVGDGERLETAAFARAVEAVAAAGGGTVEVPPGRYLTGTIRIESGTRLHLEAGATLLGSPRPQDYPVGRARVGGVERDAHSALIEARDAHDVALTGPGTVDGQGRVWWERHRTGGLSAARPRLVSFVGCRGVRVEDVALRDSPFWTLHPLESEDVTIRGVTITAPPDSPNTDGIDIDSSRRVHVADCEIAVGDDALVLKAGKGEEGRRRAGPTEDVVIERCRVGHAHGGLVIGSEMSGDVRRVRVSGLVLEGSGHGIRIKTKRGRGGVVEDVEVADVEMRGVDRAFQITTFYQEETDATRHAVNETTPRLRDLRFRRIRVHSARRAGKLRGLPEMPLDGVRLEDVTVRAEHGLDVHDARDLVARGLVLHVEEGPALSAERVRGLSLQGLRVPVTPREEPFPLVVLRETAGVEIGGARFPAGPALALRGATHGVFLEDVVVQEGDVFDGSDPPSSVHIVAPD